MKEKYFLGETMNMVSWPLKVMKSKYVSQSILQHLKSPFSSYLVPLFQNLSYQNEFDLHENEPEGGTHSHVNDFTRRLVLNQRQKATRKWPIVKRIFFPCSWGMYPEVLNEV